jgi:hypothetical protein
MFFNTTHVVCEHLYKYRIIFWIFRKHCHNFLLEGDESTDATCYCPEKWLHLEDETMCMPNVDCGKGWGQTDTGMHFTPCAIQNRPDYSVNTAAWSSGFKVSDPARTTSILRCEVFM